MYDSISQGKLPISGGLGLGSAVVGGALGGPGGLAVGVGGALGSFLINDPAVHLNLVMPETPAAYQFMQDMGFFRKQ